jgi:integrase
VPSWRASQSRRLATKAPPTRLRNHRVGQAAERLKARSEWDNNDLVFCNEVGWPINVNNLLNRSFRPLLARAGLPRIRFHDLRHTAATLLLGRGVHPKILSEMLGHSQVSITLDLYSHVTPRMHQEAARIFDALLSRGRS